jgi:hypothetical protein
MARLLGIGAIFVIACTRHDDNMISMMRNRSQVETLKMKSEPVLVIASVIGIRP